MTDVQIFELIRPELKKKVINDISGGKYSEKEEEYTIEDLKGMYKLNDEKQIISINLIGKIKNLNKVIEHLKKLNHIKELLLSDNNIESISFIGNFTSLESLSLDYNAISNLDPLLNLRNLKKLSLVRNGIEFLPDLKSLEELTFLDLSNNKIVNLSSLKNLKNLNVLRLAYNNIDDLSSIVVLQKLRFLDLSNNKLVDIFPIGKLAALEELYLNKNSISDITAIGDLKELKVLSINENYISDLSPLMKVENLEEVDMTHNRITEIPKSTSWNFKKLFYLNLRSNKLESVPSAYFEIFNNYDIEKIKGLKNKVVKQQRFEDAALLRDVEKEMAQKLLKAPKGSIADLYVPGIEMLLLDNNPIKSPPIEIIKQGRDAIQNYFKQVAEQDIDYLFEAKLLILGEPGAGKTSLAWKIVDPNCELPKEEDTTKGIDVQHYYFQLNKEDFEGSLGKKAIVGRSFRLNIWDFGGQAIYKSTHRFFLSKRSLYALVADSRNENTDFNYWLHIVEIFGNDSPLLIILNEKHQRKRSIDVAMLKSRFGNIQDVLEVDFAEPKNLRLEKLVRAIRYHVTQLPHVGSPVPAKWSIVREAVVDDTRNTITLQEYIHLCRTNGVTKLQDTLVLSQYFHEIGVFLHFQDDDLLNKIIFLKPNWATNAVYKVLDHEILEHKQGRFDRKDIEGIWSDEEFYLVQSELLKLMQKFYLTYEIDNSGEYIVPERLPSQQPPYHWHTEENLHFLYRYGFFMPKGILSQFIVQMYYMIADNNLVWKNGVIMKRNGAIAEITESYDARTIRIRISGTDKRDFMTIISNQLDRINSQFEKLEVSKLVPCNCKECRDCDNPNFYPFEELKRRIEKGRKEIECSRSYELVNVQSLLDEVFNKAVLFSEKSDQKNTFDMSNTKRNQIFISYSHRDKEVLKRVQIHLKVLEKEGLNIDWWDDTKIKAGMKWKEEIEKALLNSKVAILLVSTDFLASDFITNNELPPLLSAAKESGVEILPLIVGPSRFTKHNELSVFQSVNDPNKPLSSLLPHEQDEVLLDLVDRIEDLTKS